MDIYLLQLSSMENLLVDSTNLYAWYFLFQYYYDGQWEVIRDMQYNCLPVTEISSANEQVLKAGKVIASHSFYGM